MSHPNKNPYHPESLPQLIIVNYFEVQHTILPGQYSLNLSHLVHLSLLFISSIPTIPSLSFLLPPLMVTNFHQNMQSIPCNLRYSAFCFDHMPLRSDIPII